MGQLSEHQKQALALIKDMGGWVTWNYLHYMGMNSPSPLISLVNKGLLEQRVVETAYIYNIKQWRLTAKGAEQ